MMKKLFLVVSVVAFLSTSLVSCTEVEMANYEQSTDKDKNCPPSDRNCNGIPDNQE